MSSADDQRLLGRIEAQLAALTTMVDRIDKRTESCDLRIDAIESRATYLSGAMAVGSAIIGGVGALAATAVGLFHPSPAEPSIVRKPPAESRPSPADPMQEIHPPAASGNPD